MWKNKLLTTIKKYSIISALFAQIPELARRSLAKPSRYRPPAMTCRQACRAGLMVSPKQKNMPLSSNG